MAPRREILDSDDEDDDFSPVKGAAVPSRVEESIDQSNDNSNSPRNRRAESTDPSFFRNVYEDHQVAGNEQQSGSSGAAALSNGVAVSTSSLNPPLTSSHPNKQQDHSHLSSITDPVPASRRKQRKSDMKEVADLTQVTTPGRPTTSVPADIWDFPASQDEEASSGVAPTASTKKKITIKLKKSEKPKSTLSSETQSPDGQNSSAHLPALSITPGYQNVDKASPGPRQKRRRISASGQAASDGQEVDLRVIPRSEDKVQSGKDYITSVGHSSSVIDDSLKARTTSLLVVPSTTMTPSQKEEFKFVSLSSETDGGQQHLDLPIAAGQAEDLHKSSGSATIKYPTPIEYASSSRREPHPGEYGTAASSRPKRGRKPVDSDPHSSPDIISAPIFTKKKAANNWELEEDNYAERHVRDRIVEDYSLPDYAEMELKLASVSQKPPQKKTRGRKRKEVTVEETLPDTAPSLVEEDRRKVDDEVAESPAEPAPKRRRGRPRKETQSQVIVIDDDPDTFQPEPEEASVAAYEAVETPKPKKKRGRPKKAETSKSAEKVTLDDNSPEALLDQEGHKETMDAMGRETGEQAGVKNTSGTRALAERDSNSSLGVSPTKHGTTAEGGVDETAKENQLAEVKSKGTAKKDETKPATPSSQPGKVQYRVGLSRKTRIAPLLKSFRK